MKLRLKSLFSKACILGTLPILSLQAMDRQEILEQFNGGNFTIPQLDKSIQRVIVQFGDPGFDGSDVLEAISAYTLESDAIIINVTNLWKPTEKASLLATVAQQMGRTKNVHFCPGYGYESNNTSDFKSTFPAWPIGNFGDATLQNAPLSQATSADYKGIYDEQLTAYRSVFGDLVDSFTYKQQDPLPFIKNIVKNFGDNYVLELFVTGPTGDAARLLADEQLSSHVRLFRGIMGGGFGKFGAESRLGYNFVIDPKGTEDLIQRIREQKIPALVITSQTCSTIPIKKKILFLLWNHQAKLPWVKP